MYVSSMFIIINQHEIPDKMMDNIMIIEQYPHMTFHTIILEILPLLPHGLDYILLMNQEI